MSWLCELGWHAYRHVWLEKNKLIGVMWEPETWTHRRKCKRCGHERSFVLSTYPRIRVSGKVKFVDDKGKSGEA